MFFPLQVLLGVKPSLLLCIADISAEPEPEAPSEVERETSEFAASQEEHERQSVSETPSAADISETTTDVTPSPVKRIVIADSDDDVTDDEDSTMRDANMDTRLRVFFGSLYFSFSKKCCTKIVMSVPTC